MSTLKKMAEIFVTCNTFCASEAVIKFRSHKIYISWGFRPQYRLTISELLRRKYLPSSREIESGKRGMLNFSPSSPSVKSESKRGKE